MSRPPRVRALLAVLFALAASALLAAPAQGQVWAEVFDPYELATLELQLDPADWDRIRFNTTNEIEVLAAFAATGEEPILALAEDPYAGGDDTESFAGLRARVSARVSSVRAQAAANVPAPRR